MEIESQLLPISNITLSIRKKICQNIYRIPGEVANFFGSSNQKYVANEPNSPLNGRGSCGGRNI